MKKAKIKAIEYYLPETILSNESLASSFPDWTAEKIELKTGIRQRHTTSKTECASDLAFEAAKKLFNSGACSPEEIDFLLLCTQSPDYFLPATACILQNRLGIPTKAGALDFNLGCSGYIYGLSLAKGLIETGQVKNVLLITAETYTKFINKEDISTRTIFGDAAAATYIEVDETSSEKIGPFIFGSDGSGEKNLIVKNGGLRSPSSQPANLYMNGPEIFSFTIKNVPSAVHSLLEKANESIDSIDHFIFHQANTYMLKHLRDKIKIPKEKFYVNMVDHGNTVSSTIPIAYKDALDSNLVTAADKIALVGFGVGYSWAGVIIK